MSKLTLLALSLLLLTACAPIPTQMSDDPEYAPLPPSAMIAPPQFNGGIYQQNYSMTLYETRRARHIGDILTVILEEQTDAQKKATTNTQKNYEGNIENPTLLGAPAQFRTPNWLPIAFHDKNNLAFSLKGERTFVGQGESKQNNRLQGKISVTVVNVMPNGNLIVRGEKWINLNQGKEYIRLKGIVRPDDIRADNSISSARVANARISYGGTGDVNNSNVTGWLARFFSSKYWIF